MAHSRRSIVGLSCRSFVCGECIHAFRVATPFLNKHICLCDAALILRRRCELSCSQRKQQETDASALGSEPPSALQRAPPAFAATAKLDCRRSHTMRKRPAAPSIWPTAASRPTYIGNFPVMLSSTPSRRMTLCQRAPTIWVKIRAGRRVSAASCTKIIALMKRFPKAGEV
jgi:hypothetical protein